MQTKCTQTHTHTHTYTHTRAYTQTCAHTHAHTHTPSLVCVAIIPIKAPTTFWGLRPTLPSCWPTGGPTWFSQGSTSTQRECAAPRLPGHLIANLAWCSLLRTPEMGLCAQPASGLSEWGSDSSSPCWRVGKAGKSHRLCGVKTQRLGIFSSVAATLDAEAACASTLD
jgi:hypothetical protein